jgi:hypothetical protein
MWADFGVEGRPGGSQLDDGTVSLDIQFAESGRENLRRGARRRGVFRATGGQCVDQPRPGDLGHEWVETHVGVEGRLGEADDAEFSTPRLGSCRIVEQDEPAGAER